MPYFQLEEKTILSDSTAIAKHLIRTGPKAESLLGASAFAEAQIEQFVAMASSDVIPKVKTIEATTFGTTINPDAHTMAVKGLKETCKVLNTQIFGPTYDQGVSSATSSNVLGKMGVSSICVPPTTPSLT